jgi:ABC transport system ATP-binding/permease protein
VNLVNLENASKAYGPRVLLDRVSLGVATGDRIGVVGSNGAGKSTLLATLAGTARLDSGRATRARDLRIGYLPQGDNGELGGTVREAVFGSLAEHEWGPDASSRGVIAALLSGIDINSNPERLSGGEHRRVALAALLRERHDLLLLDEPSNHLDIEAISWLAGHLSARGEAFVVVTHDRWLLDAVTERTWEVAGGKVHAYEGGYSAYVLARAERARIADTADARRRALLRKELAWLRRGPPARTSKPRFRVEAANALIADEPAPRDGVELATLATARLGKTVIDVEDVTVSAGLRVLLDDVTWQLGPGERVGLVGVNGSGKTTLLRLLAGLLPDPALADLAVTGQVTRGATVRLGYLTQQPLALEPDVRAIEAAEGVRASVQLGKGELSAGQLLLRLGLDSERQRTQVRDLSGGEHRRLQLLMVLMSEPNVLLLDEPTNDLDIDTLTAVEDLLDGWPGSMLVASHDRYFLERVTDHVLGLLDGKLAYLPGGVAEYLERRDRDLAARHGPGPSRTSRGGQGTSPANRGRPAASRTTRGPRTARGGPAASPANRGRPGPSPADGGGPTASPAARQRAAQKELARLERQLARVSEREAELNAALIEHAADYAELIELGAQLVTVREEKAHLEERWLAVAEEL